MARYRERVKRIVDATCLTFNCQFSDGAGGVIDAVAGDYIVTESDGEQSIMDAEEFNETFELVAQKGPKAKKTDTDELEG